MHHPHSFKDGREHRPLFKIKPWEAGRPQAGGPHPSVPTNSTTSHPPVNQPPTTTVHHPAPHSVLHKTAPSVPGIHKKLDRYQWSVLLVITVAGVWAAISTLTYVLGGQGSSTQSATRTSTPSSVAGSMQASVTNSASASRRPTVTTTKKSSTSSSKQAVLPVSSTSAVASSVMRSSATSQAVQQVPSTRTEQRKLLKAIQDAKRARQEGAASTGTQE